MQESWRRRAKIVCTLGPSSSDPETIRKLVDAGMDVARLNFSHGDYEFHKKLCETTRQAAKEADRMVAILQDLQGPKIRLGTLKQGGVQVKTGEKIHLFPEGATPSKKKADHVLPVSAEIAKPISASVEVGAAILFDDGKISTTVVEVDVPELVVEVNIGGPLTSKKGMNLPGTPLNIACVTEKDLKDLEFGLSIGVDAVALSFVRGAEDIEFVKDKINQSKQRAGSKPWVFAKIEREEAVENQESIIEVADGLLVARGDMATELGAERVPIVQKQLIQGCNELGVPIITATQMLESMILSPTPTRAEANDVANAVFDGTDAVMLSGETASGRYPVETVQTMAKIVSHAEQSSSEYSVHAALRPLPGSIVDSIEYSASKIAAHVSAESVVCITHTGRAARVLSKYRPQPKIIAITDNEDCLRKLSLVWGINGILINKIVETDDLFSMVEKVLLDHKKAEKGDLIVVTAGIPSLRRGTTNMIKVHKVGAPIERGA